MFLCTYKFYIWLIYTNRRYTILKWNSPTKNFLFLLLCVRIYTSILMRDYWILFYSMEMRHGTLTIISWYIRYGVLFHRIKFKMHSVYIDVEMSRKICALQNLHPLFLISRTFYTDSCWKERQPIGSSDLMFFDPHQPCEKSIWPKLDVVPGTYLCTLYSFMWHTHLKVLKNKKGLRVKRHFSLQ